MSISFGLLSFDNKQAEACTQNGLSFLLIYHKKAFAYFRSLTDDPSNKPFNRLLCVSERIKIMNIKRFFFVVITIVFCLSSIINAQEHRVIQAGVLNGKAVSLPKPAYPQIARAVRASGTVVVQVVIDEEGNVISASAISGHPLLKAASVQAAQGAKFSPTLLEGKPVRVTGTINYNFISEISWIDIGTELGRAEKSNTYTISASVMPSLRLKQFDSESNELQELQAASFIFKNKETSSSNESGTLANPKGVTTVIGTKGGNAMSSEEYSRRLRSTINSIQTKLTSDMAGSWYYSLGLIIGNAMENMKDDAEISQIIERLRTHAISAPSGISENIISTLQQLASYSNKGSFDEKDKKEINQLFREILNAPIQKF